MYICTCPYVYGYDSTSLVWPEVCSAWDMAVEIGMVPPSRYHIVRTQSGFRLKFASSWSHYDTWWWLHMLIHKCSMTCSCTDVSLCTVLVVLLSAYKAQSPTHMVAQWYNIGLPPEVMLSWPMVDALCVSPTCHPMLVWFIVAIWYNMVKYASLKLQHYHSPDLNILS